MDVRRRWRAGEQGEWADHDRLRRWLSREPAPAKAGVQISGTLRLTTTYYFFGGARIAMRVGANVTFLHGDRLGSASLATDAAGNVLLQERYYVWGSASMMSGTMPTDFQWQNQRRLDDSQTGKLYDFNARFFTPVAARFISPDSIVPNPADPQSLNRYTAMATISLKFTDPGGHTQISPDGNGCVTSCGVGVNCLNLGLARMSPMAAYSATTESCCSARVDGEVVKSVGFREQNALLFPSQ